MDLYFLVEPWKIWMITPKAHEKQNYHTKKDPYYHYGYTNNPYLNYLTYLTKKY